jgi:hypothetical protein
MFALSAGMVRTKGRPDALALVLCAVAATATNGCSFLFVDGPPPNARKLRAFNCTTSNSWPTTDVILGGLTLLDGLGAVTSASQSSTYGGNNNGNYIAAGVALGGAALFAASAVSGYKDTSACREATSELMTRLYPPNAPSGGFAPYAPMAQPYDPWTAPPPAAAPPPGSAPPPGAAPPSGPAPPPAAAPPSLPQTWDSPPPAAKPPADGQSTEQTPPAPGGGAAK